MELKPQELQSALRENVPPKYRNAYDRVVVAGMKLLFDKSINRKIMAGIDSKRPPDDLISDGVASLLLMLVKQSKGTIPQQIIIPAGVDLALQFTEFLQRTETVDVDEQMLASAMQKMIFKVFEAFGVKEDQLMNGISRMQELNGGQNG